MKYPSSYHQQWHNLKPFPNGSASHFKKCQYIEGDCLDDAHKCGQPTLTNSPYCAEHSELCFLPKKQTPAFDDQSVENNDFEEGIW